jgi:hypothetical protein
MGMLHDIQQGIARRLVSDPWMTGIEVVTQADGDLDAMIKQKLASLGIACVIGMGKAGGADPAASGPYFENVVFVVEVQEFVLKNRGASGTRKPVLDVCERVAALLHHYQIPDGPGLYISDPGIVPAMIVPPATSAYSVAVETSDGVYLDPAALNQ